jgi:two-component system, OmpR family, response regulator MtrA
MSDEPEKSKRVLVVEDDAALCKMMAATLSEEGFQTFMALSGEEGLETFKAEQPDVVLLDVALPGLNGFEVAHEIRKIEPPDKHTIVVIVTAYSQSFLVSTYFQTDIDSYLTKPVLPEDLVNQVVLLTTG